MAGDVGKGGYNTPAWTAPELLMGKQDFTPYESDVYSLGVVLWEIATRRFPWKGHQIHSIINAVGMQGGRPGKPEDASTPQMQAAILGCWHQDPRARKKPHELIEMISGKHESVIMAPEQPYKEVGKVDSHHTNLIADQSHSMLAHQSSHPRSS
jgi:serine/threonine protein kinase